MKKKSLLFLFLLLASIAACVAGPELKTDSRAETKPQPAAAQASEPLALLTRLGSNAEAEAKAAAMEIRGMGPAGLRLLLAGSRMLGDEAALQVMAQAGDCQFFSPAGGWRYHDNPAKLGAEQAFRWLAEDPALALSLAEDPEVFCRRAALVSQTRSAKAFVDVLEKLKAAEDTTGAHLSDSLQLMACVQWADPEGLQQEQLRLAANMIELKNKLKPPRWPKRCEDPDRDTPGLEEAMLEEAWSKISWGTRGDELSIHVAADKSDLRAKLSAECAWTLVERLSAKGRFMPGLLEALMEAPLVPAKLRRQAAQRLTDDLEQVDGKRRNELLARAISAGADTRLQVSLPKPDSLNTEHLLEAAARQGQPEAQALIEQQVRCRGCLVGCKPCRLLGLLNNPEAVEEAWRIGRDCRGATADAAIALIWAGDPRACKLLQRFFESGFPPSSELERALADKDSSELRACLKGISGRGEARARQLEKSLGWAEE